MTDDFARPLPLLQEPEENPEEEKRGSRTSAFSNGS